MRRSLWMLLFDSLLVSIATSVAFLVRENFEISPSRVWTMLPYFSITVAVFAAVSLTLGLNRVIWRLSGGRDQTQAIVGILLTVLLSLAVAFAYNRLEGVARGLPAVQALMMAAALMGGRFFARERHLRRERRSIRSTGDLLESAPHDREVLLIVGVNRIAELYLQSLEEFGEHRLVAGVLGRKPQQTGRLVQGLPILGSPEDVESVLRDLEVRGIIVDRIVVTTLLEQLSEEAREALLRVERTSTIALEFVAEWVKGRPAASSSALSHDEAQDVQPEPVKFAELSPQDMQDVMHRRYWRVKRAIDCLAAAAVIILLAPLQLVVALLVAIDVGAPVLFWQQRPGLGGHSFRLYKFRTMGASHDASGQRRSDTSRSSMIGRFLRRTRLDELPQLYNILLGEMSFVGPRPLLPVDQPRGYSARLMVRPGLTGWAQIMGGRQVSVADKAALDVWYVKNASFFLDLKIIAGTLPMLLMGERINAASIESAWSDLSAGRPAARPAEVRALVMGNGGGVQQPGG